MACRILIALVLIFSFAAQGRAFTLFSFTGDAQQRIVVERELPAYTWCTASQHPDYNEITQWYTGWKSMFRADLLAMPAIREQFNLALDMMNQILSGNLPPPCARRDASIPPVEPYLRKPELLTARVASPGLTVPVSFTELIERRAIDMGIPFMPVPNKYREGKPVFRFGPFLIYVDMNVIFMQQQMNQWIPVSLEQLVSTAMHSG
ncbi:unnamed protein product [Soboliphyme baturini]|uniref:DUF4163 domain-containing protein n=1 Tax=Soboliphyme baturini TaxID=241478 RepID=A0A183IW63_9BILA|nr:unnamed protein product [Soboliphyme baturini]